jgi:hypothetical protein
MIPEEDKEKVTKYFETVEKITNSKIEELRNNGMSEADILLNESNIVKTANFMAKTLLGYSYYPWPFGITDGNSNV